MNKKLLKLCISIGVLCGIIFISSGNVQAKNQNYYVNGSTLTVTGKIPKNAKFKNAGKIKKVVVKKGVKKLLIGPFKSCKKVKVLEVPGDLKFYESYYTHYYPITVNMVKFNSPLKSEKMVCYYKTKTYKVSSKDKKYKSFKGIIYTKNGKKFVAMPTEMKKLTIRKGCKIIDVSGMTYECNNYAKYNDCDDEGEDTSCKKLKKIVLPSSVSKYVGNVEFNHIIQDAKVVMKNKKLKHDSIQVLFNFLGKDKFFSILKKYIIKKGDFYIYNKSILVGYTGCMSVVNIPEGVKYGICQALGKPYATYVVYDPTYAMIKKVNFPSSYKGKKSDIWKKNKDCYDFNNEIVKCNPKLFKIERELYYCKHYKSKKVKFVATNDCIMSFDTGGGIKVYDINGNLLPDASYYSIKLKEGESFTVQVPGDKFFKKYDFFEIGEVEMKLYNQKNIFEFTDTYDELIIGTGEPQYWNFSVKKQRAYVSLVFGENITGKKINVNVKLQKKENNKWSDVTHNIGNWEENKKLIECELPKGEYRVYLESPLDSQYEINTHLYGINRTPICKDRGKAADISGNDYNEFRFSYNDGKDAWFKLKNNKKKKIIISINSIWDGKVKAEVFKKGNNVAEKTVTLDCTNQPDKSISKSITIDKGEYYLRIQREDVLDYTKVGIEQNSIK